MKLKRENSESGFVLIVALMGIMILLAVGFFALTISTKDLMIASRLVGERKAFSAAEAGVHVVTSGFIEGTSSYASNVPVDSVNDPHAFYDVTNSAPVSGSEVCSKVYSLDEKSWSCKNFATTVTGRYEPTLIGNKYRVSIEVGIKGKATPKTPNYE